MKNTFVTAINCMDGRAQLPVIQWLQNNTNATYIDLITEPGPTKVFLYGSQGEIESLKKKVLISKNAHGSQTVAVIGHYDCAGNPVTRNEKRNMILQSAEMIRQWNLNMEVIGLYVNEHWEVEQVT